MPFIQRYVSGSNQQITHQFHGRRAITHRLTCPNNTENRVKVHKSTQTDSSLDHFNIVESIPLSHRVYDDSVLVAKNFEGDNTMLTALNLIHRIQKALIDCVRCMNLLYADIIPLN